MRILIVEDHPRMRGAMRLVLEGEGFQIDEAADGLAAIESVRGDPPSLVLLDLNIPGASGKDVLERLKGDPATSGVPVVIVSATGEEGRSEAMRLGAEGYVTKPFSPSVLLRTAERVLKGRGSQGS
jgi:two-component system, OmpR family, alkaline phosphatase synthesis response regulator PhoP